MLRVCCAEVGGAVTVLAGINVFFKLWTNLGNHGLVEVDINVNIDTVSVCA